MKTIDECLEIGITEAAARIGVCTKTIRNMVKQGRLPAYYTGPGLLGGKGFRFKDEDINAFAKWYNSRRRYHP